MSLLSSRLFIVAALFLASLLGQRAFAQDHRTNHMDSAFGIFTAHAHGTAAWFREEMGWDYTEYNTFVTQHFVRLNAHWDRSTLSWDAVEPDLGDDYDWSNYMRTDATVSNMYDNPSGVHWLASLAQGGGSSRTPMNNTNAFAAFLRTAVERYDGDGFNDLNTNVFVKWWQPGNETLYWDQNGWDETYYVNYATFVSQIIRQTDPDAKIVLMATINGQTSDRFITNIIHRLAPGRHFDAIDVHYWNSASEWKMTAVPGYRSLLDSLSLTNVQIWSAEHATWVGDPNNGGYQSEEEQARSLIKRFVWNRANGVDKIFWNELVDFHSFTGITNSMWNSVGLVSDGTQSQDDSSRINTERVSYWAYALLADRTDNGRGRMTGTVPSIHDEANRYAYRHTSDSDGSEFFILWRESGSSVVSLPVTGSVYTVRNMITDRFGVYFDTTVCTAASGTVSINFGIDPLFVEAGIHTNFNAGTNPPPAVTITAPTNGFAQAMPDKLTVSATASDPNGSVAQVAFYANGNALGAADTNSPYSLSWTNPPEGTYSITAVATDNRGTAATSAAVNITITAPDFEITAIQLIPPTPIVGDTFSALVTVSNTQAISGDAGKLYVYTNKPTPVATSASATKSTSVGTLAAHGSGTFTFTGLSSGTATTKTFRAFVDATDKTDESDDDNNQAILTYTVKTLTNFVIAGASTLGEGTGHTFIGTAYYSDGSFEDVTAWTQWSDNSSHATMASNGVLFTTNTLNADGSATVSAKFAGRTLTHVVTILNDLRPDFLVTSLSLSPTSPVLAGAAMTVYLTINNAGVTSGDAGSVDVWTNAPLAITNKTHGTKYTSVGTIAAGSNKTITLSSIKAPKTNGTYVLRAYVDSQQQTPEQVDTNNQVTVSYTARTVTNLSLGGPLAVGENGGAQYSATAVFHDGSTGDVTHLATWSENSGATTINSAGWLTTRSVDSSKTVTIKATYGSRSSSLVITVNNL